MKPLFAYRLFAFFAICTSVLFLNSCADKCEETYTYTTYEPVYMSLDEIRQPVTAEKAQPLESSGKIYLKNPYILVNAPHKGIHVINNSNPESPQNVAFINIPGNIDMAVKGNVLYADNYMDLLAIDISNPTEPVLLHRQENVFANTYPIDPTNGVITKYEAILHEDKYPCGAQPAVVVNGGVVDPWFGVDVVNTTTEVNNSPSTSGVGGSMARFTLINNYLYIVDSYTLQAYNVSTAAEPALASSQSIGWDIETIFPFQGYLMVGAQSGMYIYNTQSNPAQPSYTATYSHIRSCDPVVAEGNRAYVTLRSGTPCQGFTNQLDVLDITNITAPTLLKSYPMTNPHGLGIDNGILFICDGDDGLKIYNAADATTIDQNQIKHYAGINAFDVIPYDDILLMIGDDGLYQYNYSDLQNIKLLSKIPIQ